MEFRGYQQDIINQAKHILGKDRFVYLAMEVRTGKTLTSLGICNTLPACKNVLFVTKKKAISSIEADYKLLKPKYNIKVINYESLHKVSHETPWNCVVLDEAHGLGAIPKPSKRALEVKKIITLHQPYVILLSGTPTPESYSQMYHQVFAIPNNPFNKYKNFYRFADDYITVVEKNIGSVRIRDYSKGSKKILDAMKPYTLTFSQKEAGFKVQTNEKILKVDMSDYTYGLASRLKKDLVVEGKDEVILGDTPVKLMTKLHQIYSGTVKFESGNSMVLDYSKAEFIQKYFIGKKIAIFYKFKEELNALKEVFGDTLTTELSVFKDTNKNIALQIVSGREGISLEASQALVYFNIDFSATSYWQSRDRMTTKQRLKNNLYWVFAEGGIELQIYKAVVRKKDYTLNHFKRDLVSLFND